MSQDNDAANSAADSQDKGAGGNADQQADSNAGKAGADKSGKAGSDAQDQGNKKSETAFTQDDVNSIIAKEKRKWEKEKNMTPEQMAQKRADDAEKALRERDQRDEFISKAGSSGAIEPRAIYALMHKEMDFDEKGKLKNYDTVMKQAKAQYPKLFNQAKGSGDGGAGNGKSQTGNSMNDFLRGRR